MVYTDSAIEAESVFLPFFMSSCYQVLQVQQFFVDWKPTPIDRRDMVLQVQQFYIDLKSLQLGNIHMLYFH